MTSGKQGYDTQNNNKAETIMVKTDLKQVKKTDIGLWIFYFGIVFISIIVSFSSNSQFAYKRSTYFYPWLKHLTMLLVGGGIVFSFQYIKVKWFRVSSLLLFGANLILQFLCFVPGIRQENVHNIYRTINLPFTSFDFQPDEYLKFTMVLFLASLLYYMLRTDNEQKRKTLRWYYIIATLLAVGLTVRYHNSTAILLFTISYLLYLVSGIDVKRTLLFGLVIIACGVIGVTTLRFARHHGVSLPFNLNTLVTRVDAFFTKEPDDVKFDLYQGEAQIKYGKIAIAGGRGIIGRGPGRSLERNKLPVANADYVFAIVVEELGWFGILGTIMLFLLLLSRIGTMMKKTDDEFLSLVALGCGLTIVLQALISILVVVDLIPSTGQPLPLISAGGNSIFSISIGLGIIMSVSRTINMEAANIDEDSEPSTPVITFDDDADDEIVDLTQQKISFDNELDNND